MLCACFLLLLPRAIIIIILGQKSSPADRKPATQTFQYFPDEHKDAIKATYDLRDLSALLIVPVQWEGNEMHLVFEGEGKTVRLRAGPDAETKKWIKTLEQWKKSTKMEPPPMVEKGAKPPKPKGKPKKKGVDEGEGGGGADGEEGAPAVAPVQDEGKGAAEATAEEDEHKR